MCKMNCVYAGTIYGQFGSGQHSCKYSLAMIEEDQEQKTRLGQLVKKYKLPSTHRKIMLLMRGENCPFFDPVYTGKKRRILRPKPPLAKNPRKPREKKDYIPPDAEEDKLRELYGKGLSDRQIAVQLGTKEYRVYRWRKDRKLSSNYKNTHRTIDEERARELYDEGSPDTRIAAELGCGVSTVATWRYREGLPAIYPHRRMNDQRIRELYDKGLNDTQISKVTGNSTDAIRRWRKRNGLESNWKEKKI